MWSGCLPTMCDTAATKDPVPSAVEEGAEWKEEKWIRQGKG